MMGVVIACLTVVSLYTAFNYSDRPIAEIVFATLLIITGCIDHKTKTIVTGTIYLGGLLAMGISLFYGKQPLDMLLGGISGFTFYLAIYFVAKAYYKKEAFGYGDVIFMGAIGGYLGFWHGLLASLLTFYVALLFILLFAIVGKFLSRKAEIAFAPYMALSAWIVSNFGDSIVTLYSNLFIM
jgi:leader peptidase (prepilin peptidase)/N-methyltransferase